MIENWRSQVVAETAVEGTLGATFADCPGDGFTPPPQGFFPSNFSASLRRVSGGARDPNQPPPAANAVVVCGEVEIERPEPDSQ